MKNNFYRNLSLAKKAGKVSCGEFNALNSIKQKEACFAFIANDASNNTKKKFINACEFYNIEYQLFGLKSDFAKCFSKEEISIVCILDENFVNMLKKCIF